MKHKMRSIGIWVSLTAGLALIGLAALLLHAESPPAVQAGEALHAAAQRPAPNALPAYGNAIAQGELIMRVNPDHNWVHGDYEIGYTVWLTLTNNSGDVKDTAELTTRSQDWGGTGFNWNPQTRMVPGDWVHGAISSGYTATVEIGQITGFVDVDANTITGTVSADWLLPGPVDVECQPWGAPGGAPNKQTTVIPDGSDIYTCAWDPGSEWDVQAGQNIAVLYHEPAGHMIYGVYSAPVYDLIFSVQYGQHNRIEGRYDLGHTIWLTVTDRLGNPKGSTVVQTEYVEPWDDTGFTWEPGNFTIQPYDWVYGVTDSGYTGTVQVGHITGFTDLNTNSITGTVHAPGLPAQPMNVWCSPWIWPDRAPGKSATIYPNGSDVYTCAWNPETEWAMQPGQSVGIDYRDPAGHQIIRGFHVMDYDLHLTVNYAEDWISGTYAPGHTLWLTVTNSSDVTKAAIELYTDEAGFYVDNTMPWWNPAPPDIAPGDHIYGRVENGRAAAMRVGEITGVLDTDANSITGAIDAAWLLPGTVDVDCYAWDAPNSIPHKYATVTPNGSDPYTCAWSASEWNIRPGQTVAVAYDEPGGHQVVRFFSEPVEPPAYTPDAIVVQTEPSAANAITRLAAGLLDIYAAATSDPDLVQQIADSPTLAGYRTYGLYNELTFNPSGPIFAGTGKLNPFAVPRVREAMNRLVDREYIRQHIMGGMSMPRWHALNTVSRDYALLADVTRALELEYAYNKTLAQQTIAQEMLALGATLVGDQWYYAGEPVEIILLIRTEDKRRDIGDYIADQLEDIGFTVIRDYRTSGEASPIWVNSDPADGLFHIYTGGWVSTEVARDLSDHFAFFYTNMGLGWPLWQAYVNTPEFYDLASRLREHDFASLEERRAMMAQALEWALEDSARVWLQDNLSITPRRAEVSYTSDLYGGMAGSWLWPHTLERTGSFTTPLTIGSPSILLQPWNPLNSNTWLYDIMLIRATSDNGLIPDPYTGLAWPQRIEQAEVVVQEGLPAFKTLDWVNLHFAPNIVVPSDAWVDWDATAQRFLTAAEVYTETQTALRKTVVHYPADLYSTVTWHDGSPFSAADVVLNMILAFDRYKEASPVYDPTEMENYEGFMATFKGVRILSTNPLLIEHYSNDYQMDAEKGITTWWPFYVKGPGAWHNLALGLLAEQAGTGAFSQGKADVYGVPQLDYVAWPGIAPLEAQLAAAQAANVIPYAPTLGQYVTPAEATARWTNLADWHAARNHFWIGTGPLYLEHVIPALGELSLKPYPAYPDAPDKWAGFTEPAIPEVSVSGPDSIVLGDTAIYTVEVTFDGQPYPHADIEAVRYLVLDSRDQAPFSGNATPVGGIDGLWHVILDADMTRQLIPGVNRLEVLAISKRVAVPGSAALTFTDAQPCYVRVSSMPDSTYHDLQTAIDAAQPGDVLKVAGTCTDVYSRPRHDITTTGIVTQVAYIDKSLILQGGYTTTNWLRSNPAANPTTLNALGQGRVLYIVGDNSVTVDGFHITGGNATGLGGVPWGWDAGGGLYGISATVTINNNRIFNNYSTYLGGGLFLWRSVPTLNGNVVTSNNADFDGGGALFYESDATLNGNTIATNTSTHAGGGIAAWGDDLTLNGNIIRANVTSGDGGGLGGGGNIVLVNTIVADNQANRGGGLYLDGVARLLHTTIVSNTSNDGSGIYVTVGPLDAPVTVVLTNTILAQSSVGISVTGGTTVTVNGILWHSTPITISQSSTATVEIQNQLTGDPRFAADGYHLRIGSPAIDTGVPAAVIRDVDGDPRPYGNGFDVGADETPYVSVPPETGATLVYTDTDGSETTVTIPPAAVSETTTIVLTQLDPETLETPPEFVAGGIALELDAYVGDEQVEDFSFNAPVTLTLEYTDEDVAGMDESTLQLHRYVCSGPDTLLLCVWEEIGTRPGEGQTLDMENNVLTAWLLGFSRFRGMGEGLEPAWGLSKTYSGNRVAGTPLTYTLTVVNTGAADATAVVLEDVVPEYLTWASGGALALNRVRWTFEAITASGGTGVAQFTAILPCAASQAIVNDNYRVVSSAQGVASTTGLPVSFTVISPTLTAEIDYTPLAPVAGDTVTFTATATTNGTPLSYAWSFGGTGLYAAQTYSETGAYTVTFTATDACGYTRTATLEFDIKPAGYMVYLPLVMRE